MLDMTGKNAFKCSFKINFKFTSVLTFEFVFVTYGSGSSRNLNADPNFGFSNTGGLNQ